MVNIKKIAKFFIGIILLSLFCSTSQAQKKRKSDDEKAFLKKPVKWGYIQSEKILKTMPDYQDAKYQTDTLLIAWKAQLKQKIDSLNQEQELYDKKRLTLSVEVRAEREDYLKQKRDSLVDFQEKVFGAEGLYFKKKKELMENVMEKLFKASDKVAKKFKLNMIFDRDKNKHIIYINPIHDYSDFVMEELELGDPIDKIR